MISSTEPVTLIGALKLSVVGIATVVAIALELEPELTAALVGAASSIAILVGIIIERAMVVSPATHATEVEDALYTEAPTD